LFEKYGVGVDLQDFADPAQIPAALESGSLAGAMYTYDQVITLVANGHDYRVVMPIDYSNGADALVASSAVKDIKDLKGKTVAYPFSTCDNVLVVAALHSAGLTEADINGVDTTPENVAAALVSGAVAGATYEPNITKILGMKGGFHTIYTSASAPGLITDVLYFSKSYIAKNPEIVTGVIKGYLDGMAFMKAHPDEANAIIGKHLSSSIDEVKDQATGAHNVPLPEMASYFAASGSPQSLFVSGKAISDILVKRTQIPAAPRIEDTFDSHFVGTLTAAK
jgi:NitT/TauT family transport system substrate-binding protein